MRNFHEKNLISNKKLLFIKTFLYKKFSKFAIFVVFIQLILGSLLLFDNRVGIKTNIPAIKYLLGKSLDSWHIEDYFNYTKDIFSSFFNTEVIERLDLNLKYKDVLALDRSRNLIFEDKSKIQYFKGNLRYKGENIPIKLKAKGSRKMHVQNFKNMSFKVDIRGEKRLEGMEEFSIQTPAIRNYTSELFAAKVMENYSIISPRHSYVRLYINGEDVGIRHIEEGFTRELIESHGKRYGPIFFTDNNFNFGVYGKQYWSNNNSDLVESGFYILDSLSEINSQKINENFDIKKWAKYFAISDALNLFHGTIQRSVRFYLNPSSGLIEPIFYNGHYGTGRYDYWKEYKFNFSDLINLDKNNCGWICNEAKGPLHLKFFEMLMGTKNNPNVTFYFEYKKMLDEITNQKEYKNTILPIWNSLSKERGHIYRGLWRKNRWNGLGIFPHVAPQYPIKTRLENIRNRITLSELFRPIFEVNKEDKILMATNKLSEFPQIVRYKCNDLETNPELLLIGKPIKFDYSKTNKCNFEEINISLNNNKFLPIYEFNIQKMNLKEEKIDDTNKISLNKSTKEIYRISKTIPPKEISNKNIEIQSGDSICLKNQSILHIKNSDLTIKGSKKYPVKFYACNEDGGGGIIIENSNVKISKLIIENQNAPKQNLRILYGGINFINSKVEIDSLEVINSRAEDAVNFIDSLVEAKNISVKDAISDAIDSDNSRINISSLICKRIKNDCLDLSFSKSNINYIEANAIGDKGISLGEKSFLKLNNLNIKDSEIGVVSKDSSVLKINNMKHSNVKLTFSSFIKKNEYKKPSITIKNLNPEKNINYLIGKEVEAFISGSKLSSNFTSQEVEDLLYGNNYGIKTIRR